MQKGIGSKTKLIYAVLSPRWRKAWREIWHNKKRTALVVLSITLGVLTVGLTTGAQVILGRELPASYTATEPASITFTLSPFDDDLVKMVRHIPGVRNAEGRRSLSARLQTGPENWSNLYLFAIPNFNDIRVNKVEPVNGAWPPLDHEVLIEQAAFSLTHARLGDEVVVQLPDGAERRLRLSGLAHDVSQQPASFEGMIYGYISLDTLEWLGQSRTYNELYLTVEPPLHDRDHVRRFAARVRDKVEDSGQIVITTSVPEPGKSPLADTVQGIMLLLSVFGLLILILSGFLVINTISALLARQIRQIGIMKAIGARTTQIATLYLGMALIFGLSAVIIGVPLGLLAARRLAIFLAGIINYEVADLSIPPSVLVFQIAIGLMAPVLAALYPVLSGTRISVREALNDSGRGRSQFGTGWPDRWLKRIRGLPRPLLLSLHNLFRNKGRLALTLATLSLASAFFIAVMSLYASTKLSMDHVFRYWQADLMLDLSRPYHIERLEREALQVPGVVDVDPWHLVESNCVYPDGTEGDVLFMYALSANTFSVQPHLLAGRWLRPEDKNAVVISNKFLDEEPWVRMGDEIILKVQGKEVAWQVVGIVHMLLADGPTVYVNLPYFSRVAGLAGHVDGLYIQTVRHDPASQQQILEAVERHFESRGLHITAAFGLTDLQMMIQAIFEVIVAILLLMVLLLSLVGGLGLMGIMNLNVLERKREIGVMRAIGASDSTLLQIILGEGSLIGLISWGLGYLLALPLSKLLSDAVGLAMMQTPFIYTFSVEGALAWLVIVLLLTNVACLFPARQACRLTIREVLAYE